MQLSMKVALCWRIVDVGIRLRPAVPSSLSRETPPEGMMIAGHFTPGGVDPTQFH
jgi:hypothetical protein